MTTGILHALLWFGAAGLVVLLAALIAFVAAMMARD